MRIVILLMLVIGASGCVNRLSEAECETGDFRAVGYRDGARGSDPAVIVERVSQCARFGLDVDQAEYRRGYAQGLRAFCSPSGALEAGRAGRGDISLCPFDAELSRQAYRVGRRYRGALSDLNFLQDQYRSGIYEIDRLRGRYRRLVRLLREEKDQEKRRTLRADLSFIASDLSRADSELRYDLSRLRAAERALARAERDYRRFEDRVFDKEPGLGFVPEFDEPAPEDGDGEVFEPLVTGRSGL